MSKIGKNPIYIPDGVSVSIKEEKEKNVVEVKGKNGTLLVPVLSGITVSISDDTVICEPINMSKQIRSNWGTMRALIQNAVSGSLENFKKELIIEGVGFRIVMEGENLILNVGFSHPVQFAIPQGITVVVEKNTIKISGADKAQVGEVAAQIRRIKKPEPYKGKGIRYSDEIVRKKVGKKAVGSGK
ncbi:MAG: 50S ribosomal protein L6 [bacterium]